ncbi:MAG: hypothetical protein K2X09_06100 [Rickettsiales bacterium]|nr:hypothetical protein [Rickettsiales bacterium]
MSDSLKKILVLSYAFPPISVAMAPCVAKAVASLKHGNHSPDVLCADAVLPFIPRDESLLDYVAKSTLNIWRVRAKEKKSGFFARYKQIFFHFIIPKLDGFFCRNFPAYPADALSKLAYTLNHKFNHKFNGLIGSMDPLAIVQDSATSAMNRCLAQAHYHTVLSFSPFHSVNLVPLTLKRKKKPFKWIAQFSDPWANNPLEESRMALFWAKWYEPKVIRSADFIIHNSESALDFLVKRYGQSVLQKSAVIPHPFDATLYPQRPKQKNQKIILRHVGSLYASRSPEPLFAAINVLLRRRQELDDILTVELIGNIEKPMLETNAAQSLPSGMVVCVPSVSYCESLEKMYDADIVLLIEANTKNNLFMPSKLSDYIGSGTPLLGIVPEGPAHRTLQKLGAWHAHPLDIAAIACALENLIDYIITSMDKTSWCVESARHEFSMDYVSAKYSEVLEKLERE